MQAMKTPMVAPGTAAGPALFPEFAERPRDGRPDGGILACLDDSLSGDGILDQALALGGALGLTITAGRVLETPRRPGSPADPFEWQVLRRECLERLAHLVRRAGRTGPAVDQVLLAGPAADELLGWGRDNGIGLMVLGTRERAAAVSGLGGTAQRVMERAGVSMLLVPAGHPGRLPYRRVLVPLDGSCRAESVLPVAMRLARASGAELVLAHVVPQSEAIAAAAGGEAPHALCLRLIEQNEQNARDYLDALEARLWRDRLPVRAVVATGGDPRTELRRLAISLKADLIIASSHGRNGMTDVPCGSVTEYLATHAPAPLLVVRPNFADMFARPFQGAQPTMAGPATELA